MKQTQKKINYRRLSLRGGSRSRMELSEEDRLTGTGGGSFFYLAPVFDTNDYGSTYHRFTLDGSFSECKYEVIVAAVDTDISESMFQEGITPAEQGKLLRELNHVRKVNKQDFLLHELKGRYLWIYLSVSSSDQSGSFTIEGFSVEFPKSSFLEYFPEVYQNTKDTFFYRYMAALQSLYVDLEAEIDRVPVYLDYETTGSKELEMLSGWVGLDQEGYPYRPEQLKVLIAHLWEFQAGKGTKKVLKSMLELITGRPVYVAEYFKWHDWMQKNTQLTEVFNRLYGADESVCTVILDLTGAEQGKAPSGEQLQKQIEAYLPLGLQCNLVYLTESCHMDAHCYLDVNSHLSTPVTADTSGFMLGGNYILG